MCYEKYGNDNRLNSPQGVDQSLNKYPIYGYDDYDANQKNDDRLDSPQRVDQSLGVFQLCPQSSHLGEKNLENKLWKLMVITIKMILNLVL